MKLKIELDLSNEIFLGYDQDVSGVEVKRVLDKYSEQIAKCIKFLGAGTDAPVFDLNGNSVGSWKLEK